MALKKWNIPKENPELANILAQECDISLLTASVLVNRGHKNYIDAQRFLSDDEIGSPFDLKDMDKAVNRIHQAIDEFEKIAIYGDYDCDGVTSTVILYTYLCSVGADVIYYIPERDGEGYGLNKSALRSLHEQDVTLVITVDNGISAIEEADYANSLGLDLVITDHHQPSETLPQAIAVVNPHRKDCESSFKELCGAGVCFKLIAALEDGDYQSVLESFADLVAVGTIGDIVPLVEENRALVKYGLEMLKFSNNLGINALLEASNIHPSSLNATSVAFTLVPRINAAGRMGSAKLAVQLLLSEKEEEATQLALQLTKCNQERQNEEQTILADIDQMITETPQLLTKRVLILHNSNWNHGIIGILCSRLLERYGKPVMLLTSEGKILKGSARSIGEFHLFKALSANADLLIQYGGHKLAAGFSLHEDDYSAFCDAINTYAQKYFDLMPQYTLKVDKTLSPKEITVEAIQGLSQLEPFGSKNEQPLFCIRNATLQATTSLSQGKHQKLTLESDGVNFTVLCFGMSDEHLLYQKGDCLDLLVTADINEYQDTLSVSLKAKDIRPSNFEQDKFFAAKSYYEKITKIEPVKPNILAIAIPTREEIGVVYKILRSVKTFSFSVEEFYLKMLSYNINYCKLRIILDILNEMQLITLSPLLNQIQIKEVAGKVDLTQSKILKRLINKNSDVT